MMRNRPAPVTTPSLDTPLGPMLAGATRCGICLLEFADRPLLPIRLRSLEAGFGNPPAPGNHPLLDRLADRLTEYFAGTRQDCHRVIRANGDLGGYGSGLGRKRQLLELEGGLAQAPLF